MRTIYLIHIQAAHRRPLPRDIIRFVGRIIYAIFIVVMLQRVLYLTSTSFYIYPDSLFLQEPLKNRQITGRNVDSFNNYYLSLIFNFSEEQHR